MIINISNFFIITPVQFNTLVEQLNCNLTVNNSEYLITYLFANFFAYMMILIFIWAVLYLFNKLFASKKKGMMF